MSIDRYSTLSAFIQWTALGFVITHIQLGISGWAKGMLTAVLLSLPVAILVMKTDIASVGPVLVTSAILGAAIGFADQKYAR